MGNKQADNFLLRDMEDAFLVIQRMALEYAAYNEADAPIVAMRNCLRIARRAQTMLEHLHPLTAGDPFENPATKGEIIRLERELNADDRANTNAGAEGR